MSEWVYNNTWFECPQNTITLSNNSTNYMSYMALGPTLRMTHKTRLYLMLYGVFDKLGQWFITHCDTED